MCIRDRGASLVAMRGVGTCPGWCVSGPRMGPFVRLPFLLSFVYVSFIVCVVSVYSLFILCLFCVYYFFVVC